MKRYRIHLVKYIGDRSRYKVRKVKGRAFRLMILARIAANRRAKNALIRHVTIADEVTGKYYYIK